MNSRQPIIVVVDPDTDRATSLSSRLDRRGYHVVRRSSGIDALRCVAEYRPDLVLSAAKILDRVTTRYRSLDSLLDERARVDPDLRGMGTTMTLAYSIGFDLFLAHAGDSRAYLCRDGSLRQLTRDHTRVQELVDAGVMTREEAATHRLRNVLTNVLGVT